MGTQKFGLEIARQAEDWDDAFVFFKHEDAGVGPLMAKKFLAAAEEH